MQKIYKFKGENNMALIGLKDFVVAELTKDTKDELKYDTEIKSLLGALNVKISPKVDTAKLYGDDMLLETTSALGEIDVEMEVADLLYEERAFLLGHEYKDGVLYESSVFDPPEVALGFKAKKSKGGYKYVWLTKGKFEPVEEEGKTKGDKVEYQTQKIKATFMPRIHDERYKISLDTDFSSITAEEFFNTTFLEKKKTIETPGSGE